MAKRTSVTASKDRWVSGGPSAHRQWPENDLRQGPSQWNSVMQKGVDTVHFCTAWTVGWGGWCSVTLFCRKRWNPMLCRPPHGSHGGTCDSLHWMVGLGWSSLGHTYPPQGGPSALFPLTPLPWGSSQPDPGLWGTETPPVSTPPTSFQEYPLAFPLMNLLRAR